MLTDTMPPILAPVPAAAPGDDPETSPAQAFDPAAAAQMERIVSDLGRMYRERNRALQEVTRAHHDALFRLAFAAEMRDGDTGQHIMRIGFLAEALALTLGCKVDWSRQLRMAAPMHDIGKLGVPDSILKKPGPLTPDEWTAMREHPRLGAALLGPSGVPVFALAAEVALSHHERWDGTGYPAGLSGDRIPLSGRIVAVVDFFDALTMDRCYRPALPDERALAMLREERGKAFDPQIVDAFMEHREALVAVRVRVNACQPDFKDLVSGELSTRDDDEPCAAYGS